MMVQEQNQSKKSTGIIISLMVHAALVALLLIALKEKHLATVAARTTPAPVRAVPPDPQKQQQQSAPQKKEADAQKKQGVAQPFVVPAPVVFYGNQALMQKPVPVSGHKEGKSAFEHTPSTLPTPPTHQIAQERTPVINAPELGKTVQGPTGATPQPAALPEQSLHEPYEQEKQLVSQKKTLSLQGEGLLKKPVEQKQLRKTIPDKKNLSPEIQRAPQDQKLTLSDLFKNASTAIASFAHDGLPSARKAGTEGGDDQGSGHQITIKEGDMKYYTLWSKFLNHLNMSARFSRRGQEALIQNWLMNREIQYVLQCGITIDMQGNLIDIDLTVSSGCPGFDQMCINDIRSAVPYPPLPESLGKKTARFEVNVYP